jgi:hypothetical protein
MRQPLKGGQALHLAPTPRTEITAPAPQQTRPARPALRTDGTGRGRSRQGLLQQVRDLRLAYAFRQADGSQVPGHLVMLNVASGPDQTEIQDRFIALLFESFGAFRDHAFHAYALLPPWLDLKQAGDFLQPFYLPVGFLQMGREGLFQSCIARSLGHLRDRLCQLPLGGVQVLDFVSEQILNRFLVSHRLSFCLV